jgi:hypothetical protein
LEQIYILQAPLEILTIIKKYQELPMIGHDDMVIKSFEEIYNETEQKLNIQDKAVFIEHVIKDM